MINISVILSLLCITTFDLPQNIGRQELARRTQIDWEAYTEATLLKIKLTKAAPSIKGVICDRVTSLVRDRLVCGIPDISAGQVARLLKAEWQLEKIIAYPSSPIMKTKDAQENARWWMFWELRRIHPEIYTESLSCEQWRWKAACTYLHWMMVVTPPTHLSSNPQTTPSVK